jgi:hypothetical protein
MRAGNENQNIGGAMVIEKIICNHCNNELKGKGISFNEDKLDDVLQITISAGIDKTRKSHVCGKECLMMYLNTKLDEIGGLHG